MMPARRKWGVDGEKTSLNRFRRVLLLGAAAAVLSGCAGAPSAPPPSAAAPDTPPEYLLGTGDRIRLNVFNETSLSGEFEVDSSGMISIPLIGSLKAAGLSQRQLEQSISEKLASGYMRDPRVNVEILKYRPFYIMGEVHKAGEYPYRNGMNIVSAAAVAGGFTYRANDQTVFIRRAGQSQEYAYPVTTTTMVYPGDIVRVAERLF
ncbi:polysaccharide biosynthesis/export family protein [Ancylobacter sp. SL191]|jgi:protein involved in polysaccharide export with SLBB domain|uniref:polysaccharide biosynthesis/export family protein n=1 Tax=Ancylobacter sp. SL191 TaxID=2995166 RepID=UPI002D1E3A37|nr:polysaccharide biosynthesis/export family protein [Ancylobacter sp. SL191]